MVSLGDKDGKSNFNSDDTETQAFEIEDCTSSGDKFREGHTDEFCPVQSTMQLDDTLLLENEFISEAELMREFAKLDGETQVLEDVNSIFVSHGRTDKGASPPLVDECGKEVAIDSNSGGTQRTEVLSDDDGATPYEVNPLYVEKEIRQRDIPLGSEKQSSPPLCSHDMSRKDFVTDSEARTDQKCISGSARKSFTSVRSASIRASGLAAARSVAPKRTYIDPNCSPINNQAWKRQSNVTIPQPDINGTQKDSRIGSISELSQDYENGTSYWNMQGSSTAGIRTGVRNASARKLFNEVVTPSKKEESINKPDNVTGEIEPPQLIACDQAFTGLSYVGSQEPAELSQVNALAVVDKFLSINHVELSQEVDPGKTVGEKSLPVSSAKGRQSLARSANHRSPVGEGGTSFDWIDSQEDESGGYFFSKRKEAFFESGDQKEKSHTLPQKSRHLSFESNGGVDDKLSKNLTCSDSRLMLHNSIDGNKVQIHETKTTTTKNLFKKFSEKLSSESSGKKLVCGPPANHDCVDADPVATNITCNSTGGAANNKARLKHISLRTRAFSFDSERVMRSSKRMKILGAKLNDGISNSSRYYSNSSKVIDLEQESTVKTKEKKAKWINKKYSGVGNSVDVNNYPGGKSSTLVKRGKEGVMDGICTKEAVVPPDSLPLDRILPFNDGIQDGHLHGTVTPVAHRTRQSKIMNSLRKTEISSIGCGGSEAPRPLISRATNSEVGANQIGKLRKNGRRQLEMQGIKGQHKEKDNASYLTKESSSHTEGRRIGPNTSGDFDNTASLNDPSMLVDGVPETKTPSSMPRKRSKVDVRSTFVGSDIVKRTTRSTATDKLPLLSLDIDMLPKPGKKASRLSANKTSNLGGPRTRSSGSSYPSRTFTEMNSKKSLKRKKLFEPSSATAVVNEKMPPKDPEAPVSNGATRSGRKFCADPISFVKDVEDNVILEGSPKEKAQPYGSTCSTPLNQMDALSPVCTGNGPVKHMGKNGLPGSLLTRELIRLDSSAEEAPRALKDMRRRRDTSSFRVLFSHHLGEDIIKHQKKILARLGASSVTSSLDATHFVADKFVRTRNMLEAMALGKPVVTHIWLESCGQASCFIDEKNYILRDLKKEKEIGFSMPISLARACETPLLQGKRVFITPNVKPDRELIASLVKAVHGLALERIGRSVTTDDKIPDDLLFISCEEDYAICAPLLKKGVEIYGSELLLNGIVTQKLEYHRHCLFTDDVKRTRTTIWLRNKDGDRFHPVNKCT